MPLTTIPFKQLQPITSGNLLGRDTPGVGSIESIVNDTEKVSRKGQANGYASLNSSGLVSSSQLPPLSPPAGLNGQFQFNNAGSLGATNFSYNTTAVVSGPNTTTTETILLSPSSSANNTLIARIGVSANKIDYPALGSITSNIYLTTRPWTTNLTATSSILVSSGISFRSKSMIYNTNLGQFVPDEGSLYEDTLTISAGIPGLSTSPEAGAGVTFSHNAFSFIKSIFTNFSSTKSNLNIAERISSAKVFESFSPSDVIFLDDNSGAPIWKKTNAYNSLCEGAILAIVTHKWTWNAIPGDNTSSKTEYQVLFCGAAEFTTASGPNSVSTVPISNSSTFGIPLFLSTTPGKLQTTEPIEVGSIVRSCGYRMEPSGSTNSNDKIFFNQNNNFKKTVLAPFPFVSKTTNYTAASSDYTIEANSQSNAITITLPTSVIGKIYIIKVKTLTFPVTVTTTSGALIDALSTHNFTTSYEVLRIQFTGSYWIKI